MSRLHEGESECERKRKDKGREGERERGRDHRPRSGIEEGGCWTMVEELSLRELQPPDLHKVRSYLLYRVGFLLEMRKIRRTLIEEKYVFSFQVEDPIANTSSISIGSLNSQLRRMR